MGTAQLAFEGVQPEMTWPEATWPEVTSVTWPEVTSVRCPIWKYVLRMRNRKLRHIRPSRAFWQEVTSVTWPVLRFFLSSSTMATGCDRRSLDPGFPWVCATGSCATPVVVVNNVGWGCSLWRPRPIIIGNPRVLYLVTGTSPGYLPLLFSYSV